MCITESWLNDNIYDTEILDCGYTIYRKDRDSRGGGVMVAMKNSIPCEQLPSPPELELVTIYLSLRIPTTLCTVYWPPNNSPDYQTSLIDYLQGLVNCSRLFIIGDFNAPDINWASLCVISTYSSALCDFIFDNNLIQLVNVATHLKGNILDLVITESEQFVKNLTVFTPNQPPLCSDHSVITFYLPQSISNSPTKSTSYFYDYSKADFSGICNHLMDVDFSICTSTSDIDLVWITLF